MFPLKKRHNLEFKARKSISEIFSEVPNKTVKFYRRECRGETECLACSRLLLLSCNCNRDQRKEWQGTLQPPFSAWNRTHHFVEVLWFRVSENVCNCRGLTLSPYHRLCTCIVLSQSWQCRWFVRLQQHEPTLNFCTTCVCHLLHSNHKHVIATACFNTCNMCTTRVLEYIVKDRRMTWRHMGSSGRERKGVG